MENVNGNIVVKCPQCGVKLSFKPVANYGEKTITCPKCAFTEKVKNYIPVSENVDTSKPATSAEAAPTAEGTETQKPNVTPTHTEVPDNPHADNVTTSAHSLPQIVLICTDNGEKVTLHDGENSIGRTAEDPKAEWTFTDEKCHLSRLHATINVQQVDGKLKLTIHDENSANGTILNGASLNPEYDYVFLPGDKIKMGRMTFICELLTE
ncbi:MAG: FHA domain-containing protein [Muribaculaceae bacterium]|nr:FHA domain-containing protein [Muribaculaceae bacterium]